MREKKRRATYSEPYNLGLFLIKLWRNIIQPVSFCSSEEIHISSYSRRLNSFLQKCDTGSEINNQNLNTFFVKVCTSGFSAHLRCSLRQHRQSWPAAWWPAILSYLKYHSATFFSKGGRNVQTWKLLRFKRFKFVVGSFAQTVEMI